MTLVVALLVAALLPCVRMPRPALAEADASVGRVLVFQDYDVEDSGLPVTFGYAIVPDGDDAPLPVGDDGAAIDSFELTRDQELWLEFPVSTDGLAESGASVSRYELRPQEPELSEGLYYVDATSTDLHEGANVYYLEVHARLGDDGQPIVTPLVHVEGWDGPKVSDPGWRIAYEEPQPGPEPSPAPSPEPSLAPGGTSGTSAATNRLPSSGTRSSGPSTGDASTPWLNACLACVGLGTTVIGLAGSWKAGEDDA